MYERYIVLIVIGVFFCMILTQNSIFGAVLPNRNRNTGSSASGGSSNSMSMGGMRGGGYPYYDRNLNYSLDEEFHDEQALISRLLWNYDPAARPVYNASHPVVVKFGFALIQLNDMDERNQILTTNVWLENEWNDERLTWNNSEYNNLDKIRIPCNRLWLPDIVLYNSADDYTEGYMQAKVLVSPDGSIFWSPPAKLRSSCKIDVTFFPFDDQLCFLKYGSWTYSGLQVDLVNRSIDIDLVNYIESGEWELKGTKIQRNVQYYPCCLTEPYIDIMFYIFIRRKVLYYMFNIIFPCIWLSILSVVGFWLPPDSGEKVTLGITVLLAFSVFMLLIAENIPATSETVPLIGIYLTAVMSLTSLSIILTVVVLQFHHSGNFAPEMPKGLYKLVTIKLANLVCMSDTVKRFEASKITTSSDITESSKNNNTANSMKVDLTKDNLKTTLIECQNNFNLLNYDLGNTLKKKNEKENLFCLPCICCCFKSTEHSENKITNSQTLENRNIDSEIRFIRNNYKKNAIASFTTKENNTNNTNNTNNNSKNNSINNVQGIKLIHPENNINYDILEDNDYIIKKSIKVNNYENKNKTVDNSLFNRNSEKTLNEFYNKTPQHQRYPYTPPISVKNAPYNLFTYNNDLIKQKRTMSTQNKKSATLNYQHTKSCSKCIPINHSLKKEFIKSKKNPNSELMEEFSSNIKKIIKKQDLVVDNANLQNEWKLVSLIFDRFLFWIFTVLVSFTSIFLLVLVPMMKNDSLIEPNVNPN